MTVAEQVGRHVRELPEPFQVEVLDFVEFIERKCSKQGGELSQWGAASLLSAMRGLESEPDMYSLNDLKEEFA